MERGQSSVSGAESARPYTDREATIEAFAKHVNRGKAQALRAIGVEIVMGERDGARFRDAYDGSWYWNCHCNGGVFNLGHRNPRVLEAARAYFEEQTKEVKWESLIPADVDPPADFNAEKMQRYKPELEKLRYDPSKHKTYLEQLGIEYPTVR